MSWGKFVTFHENLGKGAFRKVKPLLTPFVSFEEVGQSILLMIKPLNGTNLMASKGHGALTEASKRTSYQRVKRARYTLLRDIDCMVDAEEEGAVWFDALDRMKSVCHKWWPSLEVQKFLPSMM